MRPGGDCKSGTGGGGGGGSGSASFFLMAAVGFDKAIEEEEEAVLP